jgi:hypothetical protein
MASKNKEFSEEILKSLTMEDLWKNPNLQKVIKEKYPRAYLAITEPFREFGLYSFIKLAEAQKEIINTMIDLGPDIKDPKKSLKNAIRLIKKNNLGTGTELWVGGVPFKFELSRFVEHYASEKTYAEWRAALKDIGATKGNMERILSQHRRKFKSN